MNKSEIAEKAREFVESHLVPPLLHGDEAHQEWLRGELRKWIPDLERAIAESRSLEPCSSNSITLGGNSDEPEPEKCPTCNGYHLGGCHRKVELGDGEPSPPPKVLNPKFVNDIGMLLHGLRDVVAAHKCDHECCPHSEIIQAKFLIEAYKDGEICESGAAQEVSPPSPEQFYLQRHPNQPYAELEPEAWLEFAEAYAAAVSKNPLIRSDTKSVYGYAYAKEGELVCEVSGRAWYDTACILRNRLEAAEKEIAALREHCISEHDCSFCGLESAP